MLDAGRRQLHHVVAVGGDETFEPVTDAQNGRRVVGVVGFKDNGPDHVVEAGAKAAAGDDGGLGLAGIIVDVLAGPRLLDGNGSAFKTLNVFSAVFGVKVEGNGSIVDIRPYGRIVYFGLADRHDVRIYFVTHLKPPKS